MAPHSTFRYALRWLSSLRLGIALIVLITLSCIGGSIIAADAQMGPDHAREYVFHTWWFLGLMGMLLFNLVLCSWEKSYIALTLYRKRNLISRPGFFEKTGHGYILRWKGPIETVAALLKRRYTVVARDGSSFYAQKGLLGRCGATIIHIGLLWTIGAGYYRILADDFGWGVFDSTIILPEGGQSGVYYSRIDRLKQPSQDNLVERKLPFEVRALDFRADLYPGSSVAKFFASQIEVLDAGKSTISEVTMSYPILYKGYKITQNSYTENDRIVRGQFRIVDTSTGAFQELDAGSGDPIKLKLPGAENLFFQVDEMDAGKPFKIVDLANHKVVQTGTLDGEGGAQPAFDMAGLEKQLQGSRYSFMISALFPNFQFDTNKQPTTKDEKFENPAVFVMLFKNGQSNGYAWLFLNQEAQKIIGQPHPEVEMTFKQYRLLPGTDGKGGLTDYEVEIAFHQKSPPKELGSFWVPAGKLQEVTGVDDTILSSPAVNIQRAHGDEMTTVGAATSVSPGGAAAETASGGNKAPAAEKGRYQATFLGQSTGFVTYLGFMKDPSVGWIFGGVIVVILGTFVAFLVNYREVWVYYDAEQGLLYLATNVRGTSPRSHREFDRLVTEISAMTGTPATALPPASEPK
ncbi:MAG: cytochrome c biogenesis protein ResB [Candidatus Sumerlaeaceae bacterium]|nr:cytochrome c biogenesis protein ResB [Candidatus Sumerlaeaceae bacterium]